MATIVNIFGKLYTFLRRPQPENENQSVNQGTESTSQNTTSDKPESLQLLEDKEQASNYGGVTMNKKDQLDKVMTDSAASSDWEHIPDTSAESQQNTGAVTDHKSADDIGPHLLNCNQSGTDIDAAYTKDLKLHQQEDISKEEDQDGCTPVDMAVNTEEGVTSKQEPEKDVGMAECVANKTAVEAVKQNSESLNEEEVKLNSTGEKGQKDGKKGTDVKVCKYYRRGQNCWKGRNCKFMHSKEKKIEVSRNEEAVAVEEKPLKEENFESYIDFVSKSSDQGRQISAKDLFYKLGYMKDVDADEVGETVLGQYQLAKSRNNWHWVKEARYFAELFFAPDWIDKNLPQRDQRSNRKNKPRKKEKYNINEQYENPGGICQDFRLKENPDLQKVSANAAGDGSSVDVEKSTSDRNVGNEGDSSNTTSSGKHENVDGFITDYTEQVIQDAMKMAINDGLSESVIMEVIDDVTSVGRRNTPLKRTKPAKVDLTRTPRSRPEQLALGFNYHSDLVVKQSPRTVKGEIIALDTLPPPRQRPEQLAVGFNYLAEQLVKESPKSETGEVIIPGVVTTRRRLARDQLAIGFNYHSDLIAKDSPSKESLKLNGTSSEDLHNKNKKNDMVTVMNGIHNGFSESKLNASKVESKVKSAKRSISDTFAIGFSYNSDQVIQDSLDEVNGNVPNGNVVSSLIEDVVIGEGRNIVEVTDEIPATGLPAGSVW